MPYVEETCQDHVLTRSMMRLKLARHYRRWCHSQTWTSDHSCEGKVKNDLIDIAVSTHLSTFGLAENVLILLADKFPFLEIMIPNFFDFYQSNKKMDHQVKASRTGVFIQYFSFTPQHCWILHPVPSHVYLNALVLIRSRFYSNDTFTDSYEWRAL